MENVITNSVFNISECVGLEIKGCHANGMDIKYTNKSAISLNNILGDLQLIESEDNWIMYNKNECRENIFYESNRNKYLNNIISFEELSLLHSNENRFVGNLPLNLEKTRIVVSENNSKKNYFDGNMVVFDKLNQKLKLKIK